ncbi:MAG: DUF4270 family protein [Bacteroidales bacterium]|nr:DUF4270 family protein [Bacteroidales bacterium]
MRTERFFKSGIRLSSFPFILFTLTILITLPEGCEDKPEILGRDLLPDSLQAYYNSSEVIHAFTRKTDSIVSNKKATFLLGQNTHPAFGELSASLITEINLIEYASFSFGDDPEYDSVVLRLNFSDYVGDPLPSVEYRLYEFEEEIRTDTNIYSNTEMDGKYNPVMLGTGELDMNDSIIKIFIDEQNIIDKFFSAPDTVYKNNDNLQAYIRGFYIVPERLSGNGAMVNMNFTNYPASFIIYYHNKVDDSLSYFLEIGSLSKHFNLFDHDFTESTVEEYLNNGDDPDSLVFVGSPGGVNAIIRFPELSVWLDSMPVAINHAQLIITPVDTLSYEIKVKDHPASLDLLRYGEDGVNRFLYDYMLNQSTFGGYYDAGTNSYRFNLKVHIQAFLNGDIDNLDLILLPGSNAETYKQLIFYGGNSNHSDRLKLEIVYTVM